MPIRLLLGQLLRLHNHGLHEVGSASKAVAWPWAVLHGLVGNAIVLMHLHALFSDTVLIRNYPGADLFAATPLSHPALHGRLAVGLPDIMTGALVLVQQPADSEDPTATHHRVCPISLHMVL